MLQELFRIHLFGHEFPIYGYGLMLVVAFLACVKLSQWLGKRKGIKPEWFIDATLIALATGLIGARLFHVLENFPEYTRGDLSVMENLRNIINTREGGLTFYGGLLLATPCCIVYALYRKVPILFGMDIVAPVIMIGLGFGRIGCFLNGCCYGEQCNAPWAIRFPYFSNVYIEQYEQGKLAPPVDLQSPKGLMNPHLPPISTEASLRAEVASTHSLPVHPTQLYSAFTAFLLCGLLIAYLGLPHADGRVFALMLILEGFARYVLEMIRVEPTVATVHIHAQAYGLSISMILGAIVVVAGIIMWKLIGRLSATAAQLDGVARSG
jgi:phosphatidylglycerol---prolipoprotein diacylglyceryl transferase